MLWAAMKSGGTSLLIPGASGASACRHGERCCALHTLVIECAPKIRAYLPCAALPRAEEATRPPISTETTWTCFSSEVIDRARTVSFNSKRFAYRGKTRLATISVLGLFLPGAVRPGFTFSILSLRFAPAL